MAEENELYQIDQVEEKPVKPFKLYDYQEAAKKFPEFSKEEIEIFIEAFEEYDADGSGAISAKELGEAFLRMGLGASEERLKEMIAESDLDKSGEVDWPEYLAMMRRTYPWKKLQYDINYLEPARKFPEFSPEDIRVFVKAFQEYDVDGSGSIDAEELEAAFKAMGQGVDKDEVQAIIEEFDEDGSGEIEFSEYLMMMRNFYPFKRLIFEVEFYGPAAKYPEFSREEIDVFVLAFREFDKDNSGSIDVHELKDVFKSMGMGISDEEAKMIMEEVDEDKSGAIEWPEFIEIMRGFYPWKRIEYEFEFHLPARKFPEFSRREIDVFADAFREFDLDGSGSIDSRELGIALKRMGQGASKERLQQIIDEVDDNGNGEIEWPEYLKIMRNFYPWKKEEYERKYFEPAKKFPEFTREDIEVFVEAFREFDADNSGAIDVDELDVAFKSMGQGCSREKLLSIIAEVDDNSNGVVEWPEFLSIMKKLYPGKTPEESKPSAPVEETPAKTTAPTTTAPVKSAPTPAAKQTAAPTPVKSSAPAPATKTTTTTPAPATKTTTTTTAPAKTTATTTTAPAKTTSTTTSTSTSTSSSTSSNAPAKSSFSTAKASGSGSSSGSVSMGGYRANNACASCGKTVYPIEAITANDTTWHKGCFRCQEEGCGVSLTLKTFKAAGGKVFCQKHIPAAKPTQLTVSGSLSMQNAQNAPKLQKAPGIKKNERMTFAPGELAPVGEGEQ